MIVVSKTGEPWQLSSMMSSPVKEWGDLKYVITAWSRSAQPVFETYFSKYASSFDAQVIEEGLRWLQLHAKPNL